MTIEKKSTNSRTPASLGFAMPAEWERHEATWLAWPHHPADWPRKLSASCFLKTICQKKP